MFITFELPGLVNAFEILKEVGLPTRSKHFRSVPVYFERLWFITEGGQKKYTTFLFLKRIRLARAEFRTLVLYACRHFRRIQTRFESPPV